MREQVPPSAEMTSRARQTFDHSIQDAQQLLDYCESLGDPLPQNAEVFKRAGLVMAMTAWETYVEDRLLEAVKDRLSREASHAADFMLARLEEELKQLHNPTWQKTKKLFEDYLQVDVTAHWKWSGYDRARATERLNALLEKRGNAVHRAKAHTTGQPAPHLVTMESLRKAIGFLRELVAATERALASKPSESTPAPG